MADKKTKVDPETEAREARRAERHAQLDEKLDREEALAAVPQKVTDPNEAAALETLSGQKPERDLSDAPPPGQLGPHNESLNPVADPEDVNTSVAGNEADKADDKKAAK